MIRKMAAGLCFVLIATVAAESQTPRRNILAGGKVVASGYDGIPYYLYEGDFDDTPFLTRNGQLQDPAYVGVLRNRRMTIESAVFYGGVVYEDGGWFDSSTEPVEFQIMVNPGDPWTTAATVTDYPTLDPTDMEAAAAAHTSVIGDVTAGIFSVTFDPPVSCVGIRVAGKGASGNNPEQSFVSINEIRAFGQLGDPVDTYTPPPLEGAFPIATNFHHPLERADSAGGDVIIDGVTETYAQVREDPTDLNSFFGFYSANALTLNSVSFVHGALGEDGWFMTDNGKPTVEIKRSLTGEWEEAGALTTYPDIPSGTLPEDLPENLETTEYEFAFSTPTAVYGVRFVGNGSFNVATTAFVQVAEIMIEGTGNPAYAGPEGTGMDTDGQPFGPDSEGIIFIEAERGLSINDAFTIKGHGDANNGLVAQGNWGASFNEYSGQETQWEVQIETAGDYYIFVSGDSPGGWGDSQFVTFDEDPDLLPGTLAELIWRPPGGDPLYNPTTFERDWITTDAIGQEGQKNFTLTSGQHTLRFGQREPRYTMDWLVLTQDPALDIEAFEPPEPTGIWDYSIY